MENYRARHVNRKQTRFIAGFLIGYCGEKKSSVDRRKEKYTNEMFNADYDEGYEKAIMAWKKQKEAG